MEGWTGETGEYMMLPMIIYRQTVSPWTPGQDRQICTWYCSQHYLWTDGQVIYIHTYTLVYDYAWTAGQDRQVDTCYYHTV